jgi:hypothetical protein
MEETMEVNNGKKSGKEQCGSLMMPERHITDYEAFYEFVISTAYMK